MPIKTTCIGAYPKPDYLPITDWFAVEHSDPDYTDRVMRGYARAMDGANGATTALFDRATVEAVADQIACGIDVVSDGEQRRENYVHYHCRHLHGFDFENLTRVSVRNDAYQSDLPTIRSKVTPMDHHFLVRDWRVAQAASDRPVKITLPGPMTITDTTANAFYDDPASEARDLADALNFEILALAEAGCRHIQVDEPIMARQPDAALDYGVECLERCFHGLPVDVIRVMHMCCGYPNRLDDEDYPKADPQAYADLAEAVDRAAVDQISIEDTHRHNDPALFEKFQRSTLICGFVAIARSRIESVEEVTERMREVLERIDEDRLIAAPDCGLGFLGRDLTMKKLKVLSAAANAV